MAQAYIDRVDNLSLVERLGVVRSLTRKARVILNPSEGKGDYSTLSVALSVCPAPMSTATALGYESLVLVGREPQVVENDPTVIDVILRYEHILDGPNQSLIPPAGAVGAFSPPRVLYGKGRCSITEKTTNFYVPPGLPNIPANRIQIQTAYTYYNLDPNVAGQCVLGPQLPWTIKQGGEITVPFPQGNFQLSGYIKLVGNPYILANQFIAKINQEAWMGQNAFTWICSEVQWDIMDVKNRLYRFGFEFQYNIDTWNPTVVFIDARFGKPPADVNTQKATLVDPATINAKSTGVLSMNTNLFTVIPAVSAGAIQPAAVWTVPFLTPVNFDSMFAAVFEGVTTPATMG